MSKRFTVNTHRYDPYKDYRFRVKFDGKTVAGLTKVSGLKRTTEVIDVEEAGNSIVHKGAGRTKYEPIRLERGVTHDTDFEVWANAVQELDVGGQPKEMRLKELRRDIVLELLNEAGQPALRYVIHACWVSEWQPLPELSAGGNGVAIQYAELQNEGWRRDAELPEPDESAIGQGL